MTQILISCIININNSLTLKKGGESMTKNAVFTYDAPRAIGPYSQAIKNGNMLFLSGQIPLDPETGNLIEGGIEFQTKQVLKNIEAVLNAAGFNRDDVLKTTIFLKNLSDFHIVNSLYGEFFTTPFPARSTIEVAGLPKSALIEIELIASK